MDDGTIPMFALPDADHVNVGRHERAAAALLDRTVPPVTPEDFHRRGLADAAASSGLATAILAAARAVDVAEIAAARNPTVQAARALSTTARTLVDTMAAAGIALGTPAPAPTPAGEADPFAQLVASLSGDDVDT